MCGLEHHPQASMEFSSLKVGSAGHFHRLLESGEFCHLPYLTDDETEARSPLSTSNFEI